MAAWMPVMVNPVAAGLLISKRATRRERVTVSPLARSLAENISCSLK
ncbi:hypothetical protein [uncultured Butyricimonas sp.]|nr:hypothetical protein [uncultured Butyricimonas sp.]